MREEPAPGGSVRHYAHFINGGSLPDEDVQRLPRNHPADQQLVATFPRGSAYHVDLAVRAARAALFAPTWAESTPLERSRLLLAAADAIRDRLEELAAVESREVGKSLADARADVRGGIELWRYAAASLRSLHGEYYPSLSPAAQGLTWLEPVGVVALVLPWNFPFIVAAERLPFMLAAGCTVVAKPSEHAGGSIFLLGELLAEAGFPGGVFNVVSGLGEEVGAALSCHPGVSMVSFTGSTENGRKVMEAASPTLKRVSLELGGKNPIIVFADADLDRAADAVIAGFTDNAGQCCIATSRLLVEEPVAALLERKLVDRLERRRAEGPAQPIATAPQYRRILRSIEEAGRDSRLVYGSSVPSSTGYHVPPTIFETAPDARVAREELFGPVLTVHTFRTEEEAVALANDTMYGLAACIWSSDVPRAMRVAHRVRAGRLWINSGQENFPELAVGGFGFSGIGREAGTTGIRTYSEVKSLVIKG